MRPSLLDPLFASCRSLTGIGPRTLSLLTRVLGTGAASEPAIVDLLHLPPSSIIDRRSRPEITFAPQGAVVTLEVRVDRHFQRHHGALDRKSTRLNSSHT